MPVTDGGNDLSAQDTLPKLNPPKLRCKKFSLTLKNEKFSFLETNVEDKISATIKYTAWNGQAGHEDILFGYLMRLLGLPQTPDWPFSRPVEHAFSVACFAPFSRWFRGQRQNVADLKTLPRPSRMAGMILPWRIGNGSENIRTKIFRSDGHDLGVVVPPKKINTKQL